MNKRPIRVLQYGMYTAEDAGGVESYLISQFRALDRTRMVYDFISRRDDAEMAFEKEILTAGSRIYRVPSRHYHPFKHYWKMLRLFFQLRRRYDALVVNAGTASFSFVLVLGLLARIRCRIYHSHNTKDYMHYGVLTKWMSVVDRFFLRFATDNLAASQGAGRMMFDGKGTFTVVPNAIHVDSYRFSPKLRMSIRKELGFSSEKVIGMVANYDLVKNHRFALDLFNALYKKDAAYRLVFVGSAISANRPEVPKMIKEFCRENENLRDVILELGHRKDVYALLSAFDIFIMPSIHEGFGIVAIEAQASGLPCFLSSNIPREVNVSKQVHFLPINAGTKSWENAVLGCDCGIERRLERSMGFQGGDYDIRHTSSLIFDLISTRLGLQEAIENAGEKA